MLKYKYILFDLDGTITDSAAGITNSVAYALKKLEAPVPPYSELLKFIGPPLLPAFSEFCGFDEEKAKKAVNFYREYYPEKGIFECRLYDNIEPVLGSLSKSGAKLILATSKPEIFANRITEHFGLNKYFYYIAGATLDKSRSEKSQVISYALSACNITDKSSAVMVGDRYHDIMGAHENGIECIGVLYGFGSREELENSGADYIAQTPNDILKITTKKRAGLEES